MGTGHRHGRPDGRAEAVSACAQLVESVRVGDAGAFTAAVDRWCAAVLADDEGWALWLWRGHTGFEARGHGGHVPPPRSAVDSVTHALESDVLRSELATGHPVALDATVTGPEVVAAAVAFGSPAGLLAVLVVFRQAGRAAIDSVDLGLLAAAARLCTTAPLPPVAAASGVDVQPGLLADLRDALAAIVGFAHTLIHSEHRLGRVERRRYHTVIEREALALAGTIDDVSVVAGPPGEVAHPHVLTPGDRDAFAAELAARLGSDADVTVSADLPADLPAVADARALALVLAGLAVAVAPPGGAHVDVTAARSAAVCRVGVVAAVGDEAAGRLAGLVDSVRAGGGDVWSDRVVLAIAAADAVARAHGGVIGCASGGGVVHVWLDLPAVSEAP